MINKQTENKSINVQQQNKQAIISYLQQQITCGLTVQMRMHVTYAGWK